MPDSDVMKKAILILTLLLICGAWTASKLVDRANKSSEELERFQEYASNYGHDIEIYLSEQAKTHHDEAFSEAYQMWKFYPVTEMDLATYYDEKTYYMTLGKIIYDNAKTDGEPDASKALIRIGQYYGVTPPQKKDDKKLSGTEKNNSLSTDTDRESPLGRAKLGEKRPFSDSRDRDNER